MKSKLRNSQHTLEISLIIVVIGLAALFHEMGGFKLVVLNLFFLPVTLAGFYLGRYRAGVSAVLCVITVSIIAVLDLRGFATMSSPLVVALATLTWGAVLSLTAILVGTLSDERNQTIDELHEAYVGVVEVLSKYLQSANPGLQKRSQRITVLSQKVAARLRLAPQEIDDIRVAALLHDMENVEVTSRVIRKAIDDMEQDATGSAQYTFYGTDLAHELGSVLKGALPLLLEQNRLPSESASEESLTMLQAHVIQAARAFVILRDETDSDVVTDEGIIAQLRRDEHANYGSAVLNALEQALFTERKVPIHREPVGAN